MRQLAARLVTTKITLLVGGNAKVACSVSALLALLLMHALPLLAELLLPLRNTSNLNRGTLRWLTTLKYQGRVPDPSLVRHE